MFKNEIVESRLLYRKREKRELIPYIAYQMRCIYRFYKNTKLIFWKTVLIRDAAIEKTREMRLPRFLKKILYLSTKSVEKSYQ